MTNDLAPESENALNGMIFDKTTQTEKPGEVLGLYLKLRKTVGVLAARAKDGVRFKVRGAEELIDKIRDTANELGILIYPSAALGRGHVVDNGTLAEVQLQVMVQAVSDGSRIAIAGFGLGADQQDKAGGKAGTYAFKSALIMALLAMGKDQPKNKLPDTDDTDTAIPGGVKPKKASTAVEPVSAMFLAAETQEQYKAAVSELLKLNPDQQVSLKDVTLAAKQRCLTKAVQ